jgi:hypothetical protein
MQLQQPAGIADGPVALTREDFARRTYDTRARAPIPFELAAQVGAVLQQKGLPVRISHTAPAPQPGQAGRSLDWVMPDRDLAARLAEIQEAGRSVAMVGTNTFLMVVDTRGVVLMQMVSAPDDISFVACAQEHAAQYLTENL